MRCGCIIKDGKNMQMWQPESCFPISLLFTFLTNLKVLMITRRPTTLSIAETDFLDLCEQQVHSIDALANGAILLNKRQCLDLAFKLSKAFRNIRALGLHCDPVDFRPALEHLYRILSKAKSLMSDCCHKDWCASSVFQIQNEKAFHEILLDVGLCYKAIYEHAEDVSTEDNRFQQIEDLSESSTFHQASATDIDEDHKTLQKRLSELARQLPNNSTRVQSVLDWLLPRRLSLQQHLAQYLLVKLNSASEQQSPGNKKEDLSKSKSSAILWNHGGTEPSGTWGDQRFLGSGAGASGVMSTKWLGIACAKKVFPGRIDGSLFSKEAGILADLNHPRVVKFFCCGNCYHDQRDDCFIAMELMETSLDSLIKQRKEQDQPFPLPVAIDIILQIARGMRYLHEVQVAHRDLKPLNVVVNRLTYYPHLDDEYFCVKLVDFGMSKTKVEVHKANTISVRGVGTTCYRAPEVHPKAHPDGEKLKAMWFKADVYSFAVTCAQVLTLQQPYEEVKKLDLYEDLINGVRPDVKDCPWELTKLLNACWHANLSSRPPFTTICSKLEAFRHKLIRMKMRKPFPVRTQFGVEKIRTLRDLGTRSSAPAAASGGCAASDSSKRVEPLAIEPTEKLGKAPSSDGKSSERSKPRRRCNSKTGVEKPQARELTKKTTPESIAMPQDNNGGERKKGKGKRIDFDSQLALTKVNSGKRSKRKQALDESPTNTPAVQTEKKKRRRREGDKKLGDGPKDANLEEWFTRTVSEDKTAFQLWNEEDVEKIKLVLRRLPVSVPPAKKSRVRHLKNSRVTSI